MRLFFGDSVFSECMQQHFCAVVVVSAAAAATKKGHP